MGNGLHQNEEQTKRVVCNKRRWHGQVLLCWCMLVLVRKCVVKGFGTDILKLGCRLATVHGILQRGLPQSKRGRTIPRIYIILIYTTSVHTLQKLSSSLRSQRHETAFIPGCSHPQSILAELASLHCATGTCAVHTYIVKAESDGRESIGGGGRVIRLWKPPDSCSAHRVTALDLACPYSIALLTRLTRCARRCPVHSEGCRTKAVCGGEAAMEG